LIDDYIRESDLRFQYVAGQLRQLEVLFQEAEAQLDRAEELNDHIAAIFEETRKEGQQYEQMRAKGESDFIMDDASLSDSLQQAHKEIESLNISPEHFEDLKRHLNRVRESINRIYQAFNLFETTYSQVNAFPSEIGYQDMSNNSLRLNQSGQQYQQVYQQEKNHIKASVRGVIHDIENLKLDEDTTSTYKEEAEIGIKEIKELTDNFKKLQDKRNQYQELESFEQIYKLYNEQKDGSTQIAEDGGIELSGDAKEASKQATEEMDSLFTVLAELLTASEHFFISLRDQLFLTEYAMLNFSSFDFADTSLDLFNLRFEQLEEAMDISSQELEYLIFGMNEPGANIAAALGTIVSIRLAINTLGAIRQCLGRIPLLMLTCIIADSVKHTKTDLIHLMNGRDISMLNMGALRELRMDYRDHLRLLFFLNPSQHRLARMQGLIQFRTGYDLREMHTQFEGMAETAIRLWFLPEVFKALQLAGVMEDETRGRHYVIRRKAAINY
jgi:hypothetical protein